MKRFLSMLAVSVLVLQSVVTSLAYATDQANPEEITPEITAEDVVTDEISDEVSNEDVITNLTTTEATEVVDQTVAEESSMDEEPKVDLNEGFGEFGGVEPLVLGLNLAPKLVVFSETMPSKFDEFVQEWKNAVECGETPTLGCVKNAKQGKVGDTENLDPETKLQPGEIGMWKLVQPGENSGEFDVSIAIKSARAEVTTTGDAKVCAVVVFDKSKSMLEAYSCGYGRTCYREGSKWNNAVQGAIDFSTSLKNANTNSYIGLVTFSTTASQSRSLQHKVLSNSDFGSADGGTNLHAGLIKANDMLAEDICSDASKYIVVISDGEPSLFVNGDSDHYGCGNSDKSCTNQNNGGNSENNSLCVDGWGNETYCVEGPKPSEVAIQYAQGLRDNNIEIFSIGYETDDTANLILSSVASPEEGHFFAGDTSSVASAFDNIATSVNEAIAGHNGELVDGIGMPGSLSFADGHEGSVYTETIEEIDGEDMVYSFTIKISENAEGDIITNDVDNVKLTYTDYNGEKQTIALTESASIYWGCEAGKYIVKSDGVYVCVSDCTFNNETVAHGESVTAYAESEVEYGGECVSETRTCNNGELNGSYENVSCTVKSGVTITFDLNGGVVEQGVETVVTVKSGATVTAITTTRDGYKFKKWTLNGQTFDFSTPITSNITLIAQWDKISSGGGGSSSSSYSCKNLPDNAVANNTLKPSSSTNYSYSTDTSKVCTFQCKTNYTRNEKDGKCEVSNGGNGGGEEVIELGGQVSDKCSVEGSNYSEEEKAAYLYACENDITTIRDIEKARLGDFLTRAEMAKMISVFATKELGMTPNTSKDCSNFANSIANYNQEMKDYMVMACQLEIMGIHTTNYEAIPDFMPNKHVSRAEFGTVLSRILWGNKYEGTNSNYYVNHLNALKENNIITNIDPTITEYRAWVFLMLYRSVEAIKLAKSASNETVEEQVNEELQSETGSVVDTELGEVSTGTVVEVETGSTVEAQTGDVTTTTGDVAKETATLDTEVETGTTND